MLKQKSERKAFKKHPLDYCHDFLKKWVWVDVVHLPTENPLGWGGDKDACQK